MFSSFFDLFVNRFPMQPYFSLSFFLQGGCAKDCKGCAKDAKFFWPSCGQCQPRKQIFEDATQLLAAGGGFQTLSSLFHCLLPLRGGQHDARLHPLHSEGRSAVCLAHKIAECVPSGETCSTIISSREKYTDAFIFLFSCSSFFSLNKTPAALPPPMHRKAALWRRRSWSSSGSFSSNSSMRAL